MRGFLQRALSALLCLLLALAVLTLRLPIAAAEDAEETAAEAAEEAEAAEPEAEAPAESELSAVEDRTVTVRFVDPTGENELTLDFGGVLTMEDGPEIEGYTFRGWQDAWGIVG